ncbi:hypothetical protein DYB32_007464 [Aphanomyces invadans]|uniref:Uncharacterized protein n=1 Tax=Aphanomyces invadans TaxID=157072 RepID=A0A418ANG7_9STRA|nr:hypothetical protein DYB32_007464 [Aphanomyces invadans]
MEVETAATPAAEDEVPREVSIEDADIGAQFGRVVKWTELGVHLDPDKVNAITLTLDALTQQELQVHVRALIDGQPWSYEFLVGGQGNTEASVLKRGVKGKEVDVACTFCGRVCSDTTAGHYWFHLSLHSQQSGNDSQSLAIHLSMGVGTTVGERVALFGKDLLPLSSTTASVHIESVGITSGRSALKTRSALLRSYVQASPLVSSDRILTVMSDPTGTDLLTTEQRAEFAAACESARRRVARFGGEFRMPNAKQFLDSKVVRIMQRSGAVADKGFATGFDVLSAEEAAKRDARRNRFNLTMDYDIKSAREISNGATEEEILKHQEELKRRAARSAKFGNTAAFTSTFVPGSAEGALVAASPKVLAERVDLDVNQDVRSDALHMYSLDDQFTSVRTRDILAYFLGYGPSYVEWTNDSSCTIVFDDAFTVSRALLALTSEMPDGAVLEAQPTKEANPFAPKPDHDDPSKGVDPNGWRIGLPIHAADHMDRSWRVLLRRATLRDFPPEKTWKRQQYNKSSHRRMQRMAPSTTRKRRRDRDDDADRTDKRARDDDMA